MLEHEIEYGDACDMVQIMIRVPPNTGWIEQSYSKFKKDILEKKQWLKYQSDI